MTAPSLSVSPIVVPSQSRVLRAAVLALVALAAWGPPAEAARDELQLISRSPGFAGTAGDGMSDTPSISADGRFVAFASFADNLSSEDDNAVLNVFVRDTQAATTTLVSRAGGASGTGGDGNSYSPSISADGRFVAFASDADNLSSEDNNAAFNVFVRDTQAATTTLVSRAGGASGTGADAGSLIPSISADGRFVAFYSDADNLSSEDNNAVSNVFVRDTQAATTTLVSRASGASGTGGDGFSSGPSISADGRFVAFDSGADNLSSEDNNAFNNVFVRDTQAATTTLVSRAGGPAGAGADGDSSALSPPSISADGRFVAFDSDADNLSSEDDNAFRNVFRRDVRGTPPSCSDIARTTAAGTPVSVPLACTDGDGDAVTRSIVSGPANGTLGPIDQGAGSVTYTPNPGFSGADSFSFRGSDGGGAGNTATASLTVTPAPGPIPPTGPCANLITGTSAANLLNGTPLSDRIRGLGGNDRINGLQGNDCLEGGTGNDRITGSEGNDLIRGGRGSDIAGGAAGRDDIRGEAGNDKLSGGSGADKLSGGSGRDRLSGGSGADKLLGGSGRDRLSGGTGNDSLFGGAGNDSLSAGLGRNRLSGGAGNDALNAVNGKRDTVNCGRGRDTARVDRSDRVSGCERVRRIR